jgi:hypothetical protein
MATNQVTRSSKQPEIKRRDARGHIDPKYARELHEMSGAGAEQGNHAFLTRASSSDSAVEELGEDFVEIATTGEDEARDRAGQSEEEIGGPFVVTSANTEFAWARDASNPRGATREPFPLS